MILKQTSQKIGRGLQTRWREILAIVVLLFAFLFFRNQKKEIGKIEDAIRSANASWIWAGVALSGVYILLQALMYQYCYRAVGSRISLWPCVGLFLKRNLLSVFLPAGGVSSLAYNPSEIRKSNISKINSGQASALYGFIGIATVAIAGLPILLYALFKNKNNEEGWYGLAATAGILALAAWLYWQMKYKGKLFQRLASSYPTTMAKVSTYFSASINGRMFLMAILSSLLIEVVGILHLYIPMLALGLHPSFGTAAIAYILSVVLMMVSPMLRGLGAVELSLVYIIQKSGYSFTAALGTTILYRVFEFWIPLVAGMLAYLAKGRELLLRLLPMLLLFAVGVVNIISVTTPPLMDRLRFLKKYLSNDVIDASTLGVLLTGIGLMLCAAYLYRGLRAAWAVALLLCSLSIIGNFAKGFDYEEATVSAVAIVLLLITYRQYKGRLASRKSLPYLRNFGLMLVGTFAVGSFGFKILGPKHFTGNITWLDAMIDSAESMVFFKQFDIGGTTQLAEQFLLLMAILAGSMLLYLGFHLIRPFFNHERHDLATQALARNIAERLGKSSLDYFKLTAEKTIYIEPNIDGLISFAKTRSYAIALDGPIAKDELKEELICSFDKSYKIEGVSTAFYRVDEEDLAFFEKTYKRKIKIGQEALLDLAEFSLEGKDKKSLRNGLNSLAKKGFETVVSKAPQSMELLVHLEEISNEWLQDFEKQERGYDQGYFVAEELRQQDLIFLKAKDAEVVAFLNIIPCYAAGECTYDMIRKLSDAPSGAMDALLIQLIEYANRRNFQYINMGLVPIISGELPDNTPEQIMMLLATKLKRFQHFQGLRSFKEKYASVWKNKYLVYHTDFDLINLPGALNKIMRR